MAFYVQILRNSFNHKVLYSLIWEIIHKIIAQKIQKTHIIPQVMTRIFVGRYTAILLLVEKLLKKRYNQG